MNQEIKAKEIDAEKRAQERVTQPLYPEDVRRFLRDSSEVPKGVEDEKDESNE